MRRYFISFAICVLFAVLSACCLCGCSLFKLSSSDSSSSEGVCNLSECTLENRSPQAQYDGTEKKITIAVYKKNGKFADYCEPDKWHDDLVVTYSNNINAGTATATVSPKPGTTRYTGEVSCTFEIKKARTGVYDEETLREYLAGGNYDQIWLKADITTDSALTIPEGVWVSTPNYYLVCNDDLRVDGVISIDKSWKKFVVGGDLYVEGRLLLHDDAYVNGAVYNNGSIEYWGSQECLLLHDGKATGNGVYDKVTPRYRNALTTCEVNLNSTEIEYTGKPICPKVTVSIDGNTVAASEYDVEYSDNVHAGMAAAVVTAVEHSKVLFGTVTLPFTVSPGSIKVYSTRDLQEILDNPDYDRFHADGKMSDFTLPQGKTLFIDDDASYIFYIANATIEGALIVNGSAYLEESLTVSGTVTNNGTLYVSAQPESETTIENNGTLYVNADVQSTYDVRGTQATVRKQLTGDDVQLERTQGDYTGEAHNIPLVFTDKTDYLSTSYVYTRSGKAVSRPVDAGQVKVTLTAYRYSTLFYGSVELSYTVNRVPLTVSSLTELKNKCAVSDYSKMTNYYPITVDFDCILPHQFELTGDAELIIPQGRSLTYTDSLYVSDRSKLTVNGKFFESDYNNGLRVYGEFVNNGTAYFNKSVHSSVTGTGENILRTSINQAEPVEFPERVTYTGNPDDIKPTVALNLTDTAIEFGEDYTVKYENASHITTTAPAQAVVTATPFSPVLYGTVTLTYEILPGTCSVSTFKDLQAKASDGRYGTNLCNWEKITVNADLTAQCDNKLVSVTVMPNTTLSFGYYQLNAAGEYSDYFKFTNNGVVEIECATIDEKYRIGGPSVYHYNKQSQGKFIGYADDANALYNLSRRCNEVIVTADIVETGTYATIDIRAFSDLKSGNSLTIDLRNHTVSAAYLGFYMTYAPVTIKNGTLIANKKYMFSSTADDRTLTFNEVSCPGKGELQLFNADAKHIIGVTFN